MILDETPNLRWFDPYPACRQCGKAAAGLLMDVRNSSYGAHCRKCAEKRLAASKRVRERLAAENAKHGTDTEPKPREQSTILGTEQAGKP